MRLDSQVQQRQLSGEADNFPPSSLPPNLAHHANLCHSMKSLQLYSEIEIDQQCFTGSKFARKARKHALAATNAQTCIPRGRLHPPPDGPRRTIHRLPEVLWAARSTSEVEVGSGRMSINAPVKLPLPPWHRRFCSAASTRPLQLVVSQPCCTPSTSLTHTVAALCSGHPHTADQPPLTFQP